MNKTVSVSGPHEGGVLRLHVDHNDGETTEEINVDLYEAVVLRDEMNRILERTFLGRQEARRAS